MVPVPQIPRWQQYLLLAGTLLALLTCVGLRLAGLGPGRSLVPLLLPVLLWWPRPTGPYQRLQWWLAVALLFALVVGLLATAWPLAVGRWLAPGR